MPVGGLVMHDLGYHFGGLAVLPFSCYMVQADGAKEKPGTQEQAGQVLSETNWLILQSRRKTTEVGDILYPMVRVTSFRIRDICPMW